MEKIRTTVRVAGKDYTIASYDPEAHVQRVAAYVDRKLNELSAATRLPQAQLSELLQALPWNILLLLLHHIRCHLR